MKKQQSDTAVCLTTNLREANIYRDSPKAPQDLSGLGSMRNKGGRHIIRFSMMPQDLSGLESISNTGRPSKGCFLGS